MTNRHHAEKLRSLFRRRAVRTVGILAVLVGTLAACGGFVIGTGNPNGCALDSNAYGNLDYPHPSSDYPATSLKVMMHPYHIPCPGQEYSYQWFGRHRYMPAGATFYDMWSVVVYSDVNTFTC